MSRKWVKNRNKIPNLPRSVILNEILEVIRKRNPDQTLGFTPRPDRVLWNRRWRHYSNKIINCHLKTVRVEDSHVKFETTRPDSAERNSPRNQIRPIVDRGCRIPHRLTAFNRAP